MPRGPKKRAAPMLLSVEPLKSQNVVIDETQRTSMRLEPSMWTALYEIADREKMSIHEICSRIKASVDEHNRRRVAALAQAAASGQDPMGKTQNHKVTLTSAVRVFIAAYYRRAATESGHAQAGHGDGNPFRGTPFDEDPPPEEEPKDGKGGDSGRSTRSFGDDDPVSFAPPDPGAPSPDVHQDA